MTLKRIIQTSVATIFTITVSVETFGAVTWTRLSSTPETTDGGDSRSANFIDYNNDGWLDLMFTNGPAAPGEVNFLYYNNGDGTFTREVADTIANVARSHDGATWGDIDNDGDLDVFIATWYNQQNMYFTNDGDGSFTRVAGVHPAGENSYSEAGSWADYDLDGDLDLFVANSGGAFRNFLTYKNPRPPAAAKPVPRTSSAVRSTARPASVPVRRPGRSPSLLQRLRTVFEED